MSRFKTVVLHATVLFSYLAAAIIRTFPLVTGITRIFPAGHTDVFGFLWNNWWIHYAITHLYLKPYLTTYIFAPFRLDLRLHTVGFLYGLLSLPLMPLLGQIGVLDIQVFATVALNGYATFMLVRYLLGNDRVGFVCGLLVSSTWAVNFHIFSGRPSCSAFWPAILSMYFFLRLLDEPRRSRSVLLAMSLVATLLTDQQVALFGGFWLVILGAHSIVRRRGDVCNASFLTGVSIAIFAASCAAYVLFFRPLKLDVGYNVPGAIEAVNYSYGPASFVNAKLVWFMYGTVVPIGLIAALFLSRQVPGVGVWAFGAVGFFVLALGPVIHGTKIPLPFALVHKLPGMAQFRFPYRFLMPGAFGAVMATGVALSWLLTKLEVKGQRRLLSIVVLVILVDLVGVTIHSRFPTRTMPSASFYEQIARDGRDCLILEIPVGVRTGTDRIGKDGEILTFYQPIHRKRLINGFVARAPLAAMDYYRASPALMYLANEKPPPGDVEEDLTAKMDALNVGYVVVHPEMLEPQQVQATLKLLDHVGGLTRIAQTGGLIVFRRELSGAH
jgi:hypothetical protein